MGVAENKALVRRLYESLNKGKAAHMAVVDELCATEGAYHTGTGREFRSLADCKQQVGELFDAFPDLHITIDDMIGEGDKIVTRWTVTGTHTGKLHGITATNKKITLWEISIDRIVDGKFVEEWERFDTLGYMQQLDLIPKTP
jgi:predicted ester cyclase